MSRYQEADNDKKLESLATKLSTFRNINEDIGRQAQIDSSVIDSISESFSSLLNDLKNSSSRLTRSMSMGSGVWRMVFIALSVFFIIYTLYKFF
ncbi:uncharacterized protein GVI51_M10219 [Nakaseomyces glabratus]|uniref:t-SNARE coiled-coil homology domain-containing protein n=2 Tax=Candida glabrata TaxID=5478 RepID=B4UN61_CANGA|nr:uncharacterized protein CAGL0M10235g [Nakaseomyces glabratus]KAH7579109.1 t-SNARE coiled-coil homology domain profile [Nakaseomyces glabratus]KAH7579731.1 t-SNARE coiled-coil homology domain profile [Nakaseomyces glabratus]KAH7580356.1 t-SNARE coiled-coil homology domain profile [Nakaseomyces glabratus]KAH7592912.1 t-SNARE coiled-coil homology domain profile [Nakaseomyces glabratus]KAH7593983.1 t-SNARE coiled-coil homology domain profile [Nakaseomyces glabratus]|eukprot:XP_002999604.1 uncharacterized protein CAGL0M10235g [[Candida] glabrata]